MTRGITHAQNPVSSQRAHSSWFLNARRAVGTRTTLGAVPPKLPSSHEAASSTHVVISILVLGQHLHRLRAPPFFLLPFFFCRVSRSYTGDTTWVHISFPPLLNLASSGNGYRLGRCRWQCTGGGVDEGFAVQLAA